MNKWLLRTTLCVSLVSQLHAPSVFAQAPESLFSDLDQASDWSLASIAYLNELGVTQGYDDGTYQPRREITRQEVAELLVRALQLQNGINSALPPDINPGAWSADSIQRILNQGLMGNPNEPFRPTDPVTREELLSIFVQATGARGQGAAALPDGEVSDPSRKQSIETSLELGLLQGDGQKLDLDKPTERQEIAVFLTRLIQALQEPQTREMELTIVNGDTVRIGAFEYPMTADIRGLITDANKELLEGATLRVSLTPDFKIQGIVDLTLPASKQNLTLDGGNLHISGNLTILGDQITLRNIAVDGKVTADGGSKTSLVFENAVVNQLELRTVSQLTLTGTTSIGSLTVGQTAVTGSSIVLQQNSVINDIIVPDKQIVPDLVKDYSGNQDKIQLINGQPRSQETTVPTGGSGSGSSGSSSSSDDSSDDPTGPSIAVITKIQEAAEAYQLPAEVSVRLSNGTTTNMPVVWTAPQGVEIEDSEVLITEPGVYRFTGTVEGISVQAQLNLDVRLPLKLEIGAENTGTVVVTAGETRTVSFTLEPIVEVTSSVQHASYLVEWVDEQGNSAEEDQVEVIGTAGLTADSIGSKWLLNKADDSAVVGKEVLSFQAKFNSSGTYTVQITAVKHKHDE